MNLRKHERERGSITIFFSLIVLALMMFFSYSFYIGRKVEQKISLMNTADLSSLSMGSHAASGLNIIAANNLAMAGSLHVAASVPFIGRYYAVARAFFSSAVDLPTEVRKLYTKPDESDYASMFNATKTLTALFMQQASGISFINRQVAKLWILPVPVKGLQVMRLNQPDAIGFPFQGKAPLTTGVPLGFSYAQLKTTTSKEAMCHTIQSSHKVRGTQSVVFWLKAPMESFGLDLSPLNAVAKVESELNGFLDKAKSALDSTLGELIGKVSDIAGKACGAISAVDFTGEVKDLCEKIDEVKMLIGLLTDPPTPRFEGCGINHGGDFAQQIDHFLDEMNKPNKGKMGAGAEGKKKEQEKKEENGVGFIVPDIGDDREDQLRAFKTSLQFGIAMTRPAFQKREFNGDAGHCPDNAVWKSDDGKIIRCLSPLGGFQFETYGGYVEQSLAIRSPWALSYAEVDFLPTADDPRYSVTSTAENLNLQDRINRHRRQLFWPSWKAKLTSGNVDEKFYNVARMR